ncbi:microfibril-associated glycoprotein 4-like [Antedon mediterranea]|uniref:microfibril-associated glycoprotein 4-like n=1 Tax=Antedon mediterranea TaxID=105859 RepID=UPI003AF9098E
MAPVVALISVLLFGLCAGQITNPNVDTLHCCPQSWTRLGSLFPLPRDCDDIRLQGGGINGPFTIYTQDVNSCDPVQVYCQHDNNGGGWTVIQSRRFGNVNFIRGWEEYKYGFGTLRGDFWLGLENIHKITHQGRYELWVELEDFRGERREAMYTFFRVGSEETNYTMSLGRYHGGNAGDAMALHRGQPFSTFDRDNDAWTGNCAEQYSGAWWYRTCHHANLNGLYLRGRNNQYGKGIIWVQWRGFNYSLKFAQMKIRPM